MYDYFVPQATTCVVILYIIFNIPQSVYADNLISSGVNVPIGHMSGRHFILARPVF